MSELPPRIIAFTPDPNQCASTTTLSITVNAPTTPTFAAIADVCQNSTAPVLPTSSTNAITGAWAPAVSTLSAGTGVYTFTPSGGQCATNSTLNINVIPLVTPTFAAIASVCQNSTAPVLNTSSTNIPAIVGTWSPAVSTALAGTATYTFTPTSSVGVCAVTTTANITVTPLITPLFSTFAPLCEGDIAPVLLPSSFNVPPITGVWTPALIDVNTPGTVLHTFTPSAGQCATTTSVNIVVNPKPLLFVTAPAAICAPGVIDLTNPAVTAGSTGVLTYFTNASLTTPIANPSAMTTSGTYFIKATSNLGCFDYLPVVIAVNPKPIADFTPTPSVLNMYNLTSVMVNTSIGADTYEWVFEDNSETSTSVSPSHSYADDIFGEQVINLIVTSADGCKDTTVGVVNIEEELVFYVPNAFTPDADDHNPGFLPVFTSGYDPFNYTMWIYNRWGELIFETHDTEIGWRGLYGVDGVQAQDGVYTWKMEFKLKDKDKHVQHVGYVTLVR